MYFMAKSRRHTLRWPELYQNMPHLSPVLPASTEFHKIPRKHRNSAEMGKFHGSAQNFVFRGKLCVVCIDDMIQCDNAFEEEEEDFCIDH